MKHAGMVLAAGASSRMGQPKALLPVNAHTYLGADQLHRLKEAGCERSFMVVGCDAREVMDALSPYDLIENPSWEKGRVSSVQTGLRTLTDFDGCIILPIDTVGVRIETLKELLDYAESERPQAIRAMHGEHEGQLAWIAASLMPDVLRLDVNNPDLRLDEVMRPFATPLHVDDPAVLHNVNTVQDWVDIQETLTAAES